MPLLISVKKEFVQADKLLLKLAQKLFERLGDNILRIESFDGWDGSNVRVVVREKSDEVLNVVFDVVREVEEEAGVIGEILPDVVDIDEV